MQRINSVKFNDESSLVLSGNYTMYYYSTNRRLSECSALLKSGLRLYRTVWRRASVRAIARASVRTISRARVGVRAITGLGQLLGLGIGQLLGLGLGNC